MFQIIEKILTVLVSVFGHRLNTFIYDHLQAFGYFGLPHPYRCIAFSGSGIYSGQEVMHGHAQSIYIRSCIRLPAVLFRRCITLCTKHRRVGKVLLLILSCDAEIYDLDISFRLKHDICRLHIPVYDRRLLRMQVRQRIAKLFCPPHNQCFRLRSFCFQDLVQRFTFDIIHHDKNSDTVVNYIYNSGKRRMVKSFHQIRFRKQAVYYDFIMFAVALFLNLFNRPLFIQMGIHGQINNGHSASTDLGQYFIFSVYYGTDFCHCLPPKPL